jgi:carnitine-CoA ligase
VWHCLDKEGEVESMLPLLRERAADTPDRILVNDIGGRSLSYGEIYEAALTWADALDRLGVQRGDAVATMLPTAADGFVLQVACSYMGAVSVPVNPLMRGNPLTHVLNASRATTLVAQAGLLDSNRAQLDPVAGLRRAIVVDSDFASEGADAGIPPHFALQLERVCSAYISEVISSRGVSRAPVEPVTP